METKKKKFDFIASFSGGAARGMDISLKTVIPSIVFAYVLIEVLNITGVLNLLKVFSPIMAIFGLPGEALAPFLTGIVSVSGGCTAAAALLADGVIPTSATPTLMVGIILVGGMVGYIGRVLGAPEIDSKHYAPLMIIKVVTALLGMFVTNLIM